ncbi:site-specific integrase [Rhodococcus rhodochrous]|uniref:site-specific integrase n=2 Tax=Rhodococcus rhodochrous TaxID=1829 RepID=UPI001E46C771|nr:site-specific integrase [Rhodococcus rhodochrous]MCD2100272.1 site-specific integrase [Rhodococcus rhodochrous]MCD2124630.1 site-specific integrase [Rhodococcus rhodochrous]MCQ4137819.1 site-specific integrase [Rhodococcus rhodochrous]MDJ0021426.1 site-specific integrase [Rhodococcus rhodochrous]
MPDDLLMRHPDPSDAPASTDSDPAAPSMPALPAETLAQVAGTASRSRSESTRRNYAADWQRFTAWCQREGHVALPAHPLTVAAYLLGAAATVTQAGERAYSPATLARWVAGIGYHHRRAGHPAPGVDELVTATLSGIRRDYAAAGERPRTPRAPLLTADIVTIVEKMRADSAGWADEVLERRDSAILLVGFAGAFRRSELVALTCSDVTLHRLDGLHIRLRKSKTDQEGRGSIRALPFTHSHASCPPCAWLRWAQVVAAFDSGGRPAVIRLLRDAEPFAAHVCRGTRPRMVPASPLLRSIRKNGNLSDTPLSGAAVHKSIRRRAEQAGYDPDIVQQLGGHSLRAGFVTQAFRNGASAHAIMRQTGHSTPAMLETYAREHAPLIGNAVTNLGL